MLRPLGLGWDLPPHCYFRLGGAAGNSRRGLPLGVFLDEQKGVQQACPSVDGAKPGIETLGQGNPWDRVFPWKKRASYNLHKIGSGTACPQLGAGA